MDGIELLRQARAAGLVVMAEGHRLRIRGPRQADPVARRLLEHKAVILDALASCRLILYVSDPDDLPGDWRVEWEERAAIMEYDGGLPRERAEAIGGSLQIESSHVLGTKITVKYHDQDPAGR